MLLTLARSHFSKTLRHFLGFPGLSSSTGVAHLFREGALVASAVVPLLLLDVGFHKKNSRHSVRLQSFMLL